MSKQTYQKKTTQVLQADASAQLFFWGVWRKKIEEGNGEKEKAEDQ